MNVRIGIKDEWKIVDSDIYHYRFNIKNGNFVRWGKEEKDDPSFSPFGPEILDFEVTEVCSGIRKDLNDEKSRCVCPFCYKSNLPNTGHNTSFELFRSVLDKMNTRVIDGETKPWRFLTQVAFGADAQAKSNPDLWKMMDYCRNNPYNSVVPNITVADIDDETADNLAKYCGAVAVSYYPWQNKECCYQTIRKLRARGLNQTNIHAMVSMETYQDILDLMDDIANDKTLSINALIMLSLKQKGRGESFHPLESDKFERLYRKAQELKIPVGYDSCSARKFLQVIRNDENYKALTNMIEPL